MKKHERTLPPTRTGWFKGRLGIRGRVFRYFLVFTAALLALLWVFQIALLSSFYRLEKTRMLTATIDTLAENIDNEGLQLLCDRVAKTREVCVLILNSRAETIASSDILHDCVIHRMSRNDLNRYIKLAEQSSGTLYRQFDLGGFGKEEYEADRFRGRVPPAEGERTQSMVAIRSVQTESDETRYVFVNTVVTPLDATVMTLRNQYFFIAMLMVLLSFLLSLVLSRRIAQPIINAGDAARGLSQGRYEPANTGVSYREIDQLHLTLTQAAKDLRRVETLQRELIANISHDLRTPLTLIEGYAEAMRDLPGENSPENMQVIIEEAKRLSSLVNAILEYSTIQSGQNGIHSSQYCLTESVRVILDRYQKLTALDGYTIRFVQHESVPVEADEMKIGQVVYNLVNNALTYTGDDQTVVVTQQVQGGVVRLSVSDSGEGIEPEDLEHIWSRYYRGKKPHKRATVGTGLGLSIVKGILDAHGVPYGVQSSPGAGTTFWFELPIAGRIETSTGTKEFTP